MATATAKKLSRERVAKAALEVLGREGTDGLSMRRVAAELDVGVMTLYGYFRGKRELLDAAVDLACEEIRIPAAGGPWQDGLRDLGREILGVLRRYPVAHHIRAHGPIISPGALRSTEAGLEMLVDAGLSLDEAAQAWRLLFTYVFGFAAFTPAELSSESRGEIHAALAGMGPHELPLVVRAAASGAEAMAGDETFERGLDTILMGISSRLSS